jgi:hypothetical protein
VVASAAAVAVAAAVEATVVVADAAAAEAEVEADASAGKPRRSPAPPGHPESLCLHCSAHRIVRGRASVFIRCTALAVKHRHNRCSAVPRSGG